MGLLQEMLAVPTARQQQHGRSLKRYASFLSEVILTLFRSDKIFFVFSSSRGCQWLINHQPWQPLAGEQSAPCSRGIDWKSAIHGADKIRFYSSSLMGRRDAACWQSSAEPTTKLQCKCRDIQEKQAGPPHFLSQQSAAHLLAHGERSGHQSIFRMRSLLIAIG